jgi:hypothetical protein
VAVLEDVGALGVLASDGLLAADSIALVALLISSLVLLSPLIDAMYAFSDE